MVPLVLAGGNLAHRSLPKLGLQLTAPIYSVPTRSMMSMPSQQNSNASVCYRHWSPRVHKACFISPIQHEPQQKFRAPSYWYCTGEVPPLPGWSPHSGGPEWQLIASAWRRDLPNSLCRARPGSASRTGLSAGTGGNVLLSQQCDLASQASGHCSAETIGRRAEADCTEDIPHLRSCSCAVPHGLAAWFTVL